jgi:hypothetical protein
MFSLEVTLKETYNWNAELPRVIELMPGCVCLLDAEGMHFNIHCYRYMLAPQNTST